MDYLARESADLSKDLWKRIDKAVIRTAQSHLVGRRFIKTFGPLGAGVTSVVVDSPEKEEVLKNDIGRITGRKHVELPLFVQDFTLLGRDVESEREGGLPLELSSAVTAAKKAAAREDDLIFNGNKTLGAEGLLNAKGAQALKKNNWAEGENAFVDIASALSQLTSKGFIGRYALTVAPDVYLQLQRLQPNTGLLEIDRVKKLIGEDVYLSSSIPAGKAVLVCSEPEYLDLALGIDLSVGYAELVDFNHHFRIVESAALRIKDPQAIVVFE